MVNLTRIYTRTGDGGTTRLSDGSTVPKTDPRVASYGAVDEANSALGVALATGGVPGALGDALREVQNELFDVGADLSNPVVADPPWAPLRIEQASIDRLERWCDEFGAALPDLRSFILPGGTPAGAALHVARTVVRRAERECWAAVERVGLAPDSDGGINPLAITYLNRLSDLLFVASRFVNGADADILWVPGAERVPPDAHGQAVRDRITGAQR